MSVRATISSWKFVIPGLLLAASIGLAALAPSTGRADIRPTSNSSSKAGPGAEIEAWLVSHGLMGQAMTGAHPSPVAIAPPAGVEVDETRQSNSETGQVLMRMKSWNEKLGDYTVHIEFTTLPGRQYGVGFWLLPNHRHGCAMFGWTLYDHGHALKSAFWRNDPALRLAGTAKMPHDLYPDSVPGIAFLRVLAAPRDGAEGTLNQQLTPYSYVGQSVWASDTEQVSVPAGNFSALKVKAQADVATLMPNWPSFVLHIIKPFVPTNTLYFESKPPYRLLKQKGTAFVGGPDVTTELIRFYVAPPQPHAAAAPGASAVAGR